MGHRRGTAIFSRRPCRRGQTEPRTFCKRLCRRSTGAADYFASRHGRLRDLGARRAAREAWQHRPGVRYATKGKLLRRFPEHYAPWLLHFGDWIHAGIEAADYPRRATRLREARCRTRGAYDRGRAWRRQTRLTRSLSVPESPAAGLRRSLRKKGSTCWCWKPDAAFCRSAITSSK